LTTKKAVAGSPPVSKTNPIMHGDMMKIVKHATANSAQTYF
jgi:hypothetical protein